MAGRLTLRIQGRLSHLTPTERRLAGLLLDDRALIESHSATELAGLAGVSKATAARFFRSLGYGSFEEAKVQAREERNRTQPYAYARATPERAVLGRTIGDHLALELDNLTRTFEQMRPDTLGEAARLVAEAPRVWCLGFGAEEGLARLARLTFARLRADVHLLGVHAGAWAEDLAMMGPRDALLLFTLEPRPRLLGALASYARTTRANVVTLTDHRYMGRAERFSRLVVGCHVASYVSVPSHTAMQSVLRLMAVAMIDRMGSAGQERMAALGDINEELDLFE